MNSSNNNRPPQRGVNYGQNPTMPPRQGQNPNIPPRQGQPRNVPPYGAQYQGAPRQNAAPQHPRQGMPNQNVPHAGAQPYRAVPGPNGQYQYKQRPMPGGQNMQGGQYPPVRHSSRKQAGRAAGFVVLLSAILVMLLVCVIIFAARCANGDIGGKDTETTPFVSDSVLDAGDNTDELGASADVQTSDTEPLITTPPETQLDPKYQYTVLTEADVHKGYLLLINEDNEYNFDGGFTIQKFYGNKSDSYKLRGVDMAFDKLAMSWCDKMMDAMRAHMGTGDVLVNSAYRTKQDQQDIYNYYLTQNGQEYVDMYVGLPGYSEHHTGLAVDFTIYTDAGESYTFSDKTDYPEWLHGNSYKYGFVQRYPADKVEITGVAYENWHYRYVGKPHAYIMLRNNLCLEEYIDFIRSFEYGDRHLAITDDEGKSWEIYFVPADESGTTKVPVPKYVEYEISGNNVDGYIVTCHM